jgi:hypothetical protein
MSRALRAGESLPIAPAAARMAEAGLLDLADGPADDEGDVGRPDRIMRNDRGRPCR